MNTRTAKGVGTAARTLGMAALAVVILAGAATAGNESRKMDRQIDLFERVVDDMLVESPNWLVQGRHETRGRYRSGEGARFMFDAGLVWRGWGSHRSSKWWRIFSHHDDDDVIIIDRDDWDDMDDDEIAELRKDSRKSRKKYRDRSLKREARLYERGKVEMIEVLADFGDLLTTVPDGETVQLVAYLEDGDYFDEHDLRELTVTAKMSDIRALANDSIDEKKFVERVQVVED